ncbi:hypothetical protein [Granulicella sp. L60]|uniref:hypothetical protein n=1 Tax=Granulicella sp. L60 TaxID=1641866 RepID=UPI00131EA576|nr:hypothetical protein [Granulicella sp. L60]
MNAGKKILVMLLLAVGVVAAQTQNLPKTEDQKRLEQMSQKMEQLERDMVEMKEQLQQAKVAAATAQAAAEQAAKRTDAVQQSAGANAEAVTTLQTSVTDLKASSSTAIQKVQADQKQAKADFEHPDILHYKGITLSPNGSFLAGETVDRNHATGGDIGTSFTAIPFTSANLAQTSEFFGSGRQSRIALLAEGKGSSLTYRGYYEADFLGTGTTSNNNESNSYTLRQRQVWAQLETQSGWAFSAGQMWSLATEYRSGLSLRSEAPPQTIDPNYVPGFVWERQYGFRIVKQINPRFWAGISLENPQTLTPVVNGDTTGLPLILWASPGANGGNYNAAANTSNGSTPGLLTTYSMNPVPDFIAKIVYEPTWGGHYELFGIARFFRSRLFPNATAAEIKAGTATTVGAFNDTEGSGGLGASARVPVLHKRFDLGLKGLWGTGMGRYGASTIADVTVRPDGKFSPLHTFSALSTLDWHATSRFDVYANYGGDYVGRTSYTNLTTGLPLGYAVGLNNSGCNTEPLPTGTGGLTNYPSNPSNCSGVNRDIQEFSVGYWYDFYRGNRGRFRQGIQYGYAQRKTWADPNGLAPQGLDNILETSFRYYVP